MLKKFTSLLLSLLLCLSLLPGRANAAGAAENSPPVQTEAPEPERTDDPDGLMLLSVEEAPEEADTKLISK